MFYKLSFFIFLIIFSCSKKEIEYSKIQQRSDSLIYEINSENPFSGKVYKLYKNGQKSWEASLNDGKYDGQEIRWGDNGQKYDEKNYENGKLYGKHISWYKSGQKGYEKNYEEGKLDGKQLSWYESGQKRSEENYENGLPDGKWTFWYDNKQIRNEIFYEDGKLYGKHISWYKSGQKEYEKNYEEDKLDGRQLSWYESGQKRSEENYENGLPNGKWTFWYDNKQIRNEIFYEDGKENGNWIYWYANGQKEKEGSYKDGKQESMWDFWSKDGKKLDIVEDIDGNVYPIIKIGNQIWMKENLRVTHYRNGDEIPNLTDYSKWQKTKNGAYCNYENVSTHSSNYGRLYNWYAVKDRSGIAPKGWHVPSDREWQTLVNYLGGNRIAGKKMKESRPSYWIGSIEGYANNSSDFSGLPGGYRGGPGNPGEYDGIGYHAHFWSSTNCKKHNRFGDDTAYSYNLDNLYSHAERIDYKNKNYGYSVRCIKD